MNINGRNTILWKDATVGELVVATEHRKSQLCVKVAGQVTPGARPLELGLILAEEGQPADFSRPLLSFLPEQTPCMSFGSTWTIEPDIQTDSIYKGDLAGGLYLEEALKRGSLLLQDSEMYLYYRQDPKLLQSFQFSSPFPRAMRCSDKTLQMGDALKPYAVFAHWQLGIPKGNDKNENEWLLLTREAALKAASSS